MNADKIRIIVNWKELKENDSNNYIIHHVVCFNSVLYCLYGKYR